MIKKLFVFFLGIACMVPGLAQAQLTTQGGGTGSTSPSGILYGVTGNLHLQTLKLGSGLTFNGTTLAVSGAASSTLLGDTNTFSGTDIFSNTIKVASLTGLIGGNSGTLYNISTSSPLNTAITGNAGTATAFASTPTKCSAGNFPLGIDASGNAQNCTAASTGTVTSVTASYPLASTGGAAPNLTTNFSTTTNNGMTAGFLYSGSGGIWQTGASSTLFGYTPLNPTRTINTTYPLQGGGDLSADRTLTTAFGTTTTWGLGNNGLVMTGATGVPFVTATSSAIALSITGNAATVTTNANLSGVVTSSGNTTSFGSQSAGVLGNSITGNTGVIATSSLYGTGTGGQVLTWNNNVPQWVASTTYADGAGISHTFINGQLTITNTGATFSWPFTATTFGSGIIAAATSSVLYPSGLVTGTSTIGALVASSSITNQGVKSALVLNGAGGLEGAYAGASACSATNWVTAISATGGTTCGTIGNNAITLAMMPTLGAGQIWANNTSATANATAIATSSIFGTGTGGQILAWNNNVPQWIASTTYAAGSGIGVSFVNGQLTISNTGAYDFTPATFGINVSATSTPLYPSGLITGTSTIGALVASSSITNQAVKSALVLNSAAGLEGAYAGAAGCTNQFVTAISATGGTTCTSLNALSFGNVSANTILGNATGASAVPTFFATSTLFTGLTGWTGYFSGTGALIGTSSIFTATNSYVGVASTTPFSRFSVGTGLASSSITIAEYKYGANGNNATSTAANIECNTSSHIAWPIGFTATTLTLIHFVPGQSCTVTVQNPNGTAGALTWAIGAGAILKWTGGSTPTQTTTANTYDIYSFLASQGSSTIEVVGAATLNN